LTPQTFPYNTSYSVPALILEAEIVHPNPEDKRRIKIEAKVDTGADGCVIPAKLKDEWNLNKTGEDTYLDYTGNGRKEPIYDIRVIIEGLISKIVGATVGNRTTLLLGRDILNDLILHADGKVQFFTLEDP
jgi:predicted aspartyl protease